MKSLPNKIKNLEKIKKKLLVPDFIFFKKSEFDINEKKILLKITRKFKKNVIIRSSSFNEDKNLSNAGKYLSIADVPVKNFSLLKKSIQKVFNSYEKKNPKNNYLFVQDYISNAKKVG